MEPIVAAITGSAAAILGLVLTGWRIVHEVRKGQDELQDQIGEIKRAERADHKDLWTVYLEIQESRLLALSEAMNKEVDNDRKQHLSGKHRSAQDQYFDLLDRAITSPDIVDQGLRDDPEFTAFLTGNLERKGFSADAPAEEIRLPESDVNELKETLRGLRRASASMTVSADEHILRGNAYYSVSDFEHAADEYGKAVDLAPSNLRAISNLGTALVALGNLDEALKAYDQALLMSDNSKLHCYRGITLSDMDEPEEALKAYKRSIHLDSNEPLAFYGQGRALEKLGDISGAIAAYDEALRLDPSSSAIYSLAAALKLSGDKIRATAAYGASSERQASIAADYYHRARMYAVFDEPAKAVSDLRNAISKHPPEQRYARRDPSFDSIRDDPEFLRLIGTT